MAKSVFDRSRKESIQPPVLARVDTDRAELYTIEDFLDAAECRRVIEIMKGSLRRSTITMENEPDKYFRRSRTCDLSFIDVPVVRRLDRMICETMRIPPALAEPTQGQYYDVGDEFKPHTDYFESYELERYSTPAWGQRSWTFMLYLNEPEGGGETAFVNLGLAIKPKTGRALVWNNLTPLAEPNPDTIHQGTPVTAGYKAILTKWFRNPR
jgi:prolyl 4-hydroxylase